MKAYPMGLSKAVDTVARLDFGGPSFGCDGYASGDGRRDCRAGARLSLRREPSCSTAQPDCPLGLRAGIPRGDRQSGALFRSHRAPHTRTLSPRRACVLAAPVADEILSPTCDSRMAEGACGGDAAGATGLRDTATDLDGAFVGQLPRREDGHRRRRADRAPLLGAFGLRLSSADLDRAPQGRGAA